jgi:polysaccharide biosynthesis/export protein ExoF
MKRAPHRVSHWPCLLVAIAWLAGAMLPPFPLQAESLRHRIDTGDRLRIRVQQWPDVSGEYMVGPRKTLSLPVVGDISIDDMDTQQISRLVADKLRDVLRLKETPQVVVDVATYRPYFVLGYVQRPGQYVYTPDMTVLQAVGMAGGLYRAADAGQLRIEREAITTTGDAETIRWAVHRLLAREARLEAEEFEQTEIAFPPRLQLITGDPALVNIMNGERKILAANRENHLKSLTTQSEMRLLFAKELDAIEEQAMVRSEQINFVEKDLANVKSLFAKGLTTTQRVFVAESTLIQFKNERLALYATELRIRQSIAISEQRTRELIALRTDNVGNERQRTRAELRELELRARTINNLGAEIRAASGALTEQGREAPISFVLVRKLGAAFTEIAASESTPIEPSDVLKVIRKPVQDVTNR